MNSGYRFRINSPSIVNETIDGEAVMINLDTGSYYSTDRIGAIVWSWIDAGHSIDEILGMLTARYTGDLTAIESATRLFIRQLVVEALIVPAPSDARSPQLAPSNGDRETFVAPTLERYDDMKDLLLADPIHDVDAAGWPHHKETSQRD
jgi:hypothetical protein